LPGVNISDEEVRIVVVVAAIEDDEATPKALVP
jgi:hypothetical protein